MMPNMGSMPVPVPLAVLEAMHLMAAQAEAYKQAAGGMAEQLGMHHDEVADLRQRIQLAVGMLTGGPDVEADAVVRVLTTSTVTSDEAQP